jgi:serralysin
LFNDDFSTVNIASQSNPSGTWMPNDFAWQSKTQGYKDFAGTNWNLNPNDPTTGFLSAFSTSSGILTISAFRTPSNIVSAIQAEMNAQGVSGAVPAWCGGMMVSQYQYTHGYLEYRARWPNTGKGIFPALWMYLASGVNLPAKGQAEIDLFEMFGQAGSFSTGMYLRDSSGAGTNRGLGTYTLDTTQWHTYGIDRQPGWVRVYLDGAQIYEMTSTEAAWFSEVPMNIRLNYAMDATWFAGLGLSSDASTPSPLFMSVDYVKVWATKP